MDPYAVTQGAGLIALGAFSAGLAFAQRELARALTDADSFSASWVMRVPFGLRWLVPGDAAARRCIGGGTTAPQSLARFRRAAHRAAGGFALVSAASMTLGVVLVLSALA